MRGQQFQHPESFLDGKKGLFGARDAGRFCVRGEFFTRLTSFVVGETPSTLRSSARNDVSTLCSRATEDGLSLDFSLERGAHRDKVGSTSLALPGRAAARAHGWRWAGTSARAGEEIA